MGVLVEKFKSDFHLVKSGDKGWYISRVRDTGLYCPFCHNENSQKLAFIFSDNVCSWKCPKCGNSLRLEQYLWRVKKQQYITNQRQIQPQDILKKKSLIKQYEKEEIKELEEVSLPLFFKRLKYSPYLQNRGAKIDLYKYWIIGKTDFEKDLKDYLIFIIPENEVPVGYVARSQKSKKEIDEYNKTHKDKILRWKNSQGDFAQMVFGLDEITEETEELIIVEGITSKMRVDCNLDLYKQHKIICCCTFGKKLSPIQLEKIEKKGINIKKIILFYDSDAINASKKTIYQLVEKFKEVKIAFCTYKDEEGNYKDAGDLNKEELLQILNKAQSPFEFFESKIEKKKLINKNINEFPISKITIKKKKLI